jgi:hypothetical protein
LGANACSLVLVLEAELVENGKPKILYASAYQGDEATILMWFAKLGLGHY